MLRHLQHTVRSLALAGVATAALLAPHAAMARPAVENGQVLVKHTAIDLRSPDAVTPIQVQQPKVDLRSPDATTPVEFHPSTPAVHADSNDNDFDFGDAAIGAGTALIVALTGAGTVLAINRRRTSVSLGG